MLPRRTDVRNDFSSNKIVMMMKTSRILMLSFVRVCSVPRSTSSLIPLLDVK